MTLVLGMSQFIELFGNCFYGEMHKELQIMNLIALKERCIIGDVVLCTITLMDILRVETLVWALVHLETCVVEI